MIPSLSSSQTYELAVEVYRRHDDSGTGICMVCGQRAPCPPRRHAASVILAAGENPRRYDGSFGLIPGRPDNLAHDPVHQRLVSDADDARPAYRGFGLTGRPRALGDEGYRYERDTE